MMVVVVTGRGEHVSTRATWPCVEQVARDRIESEYIRAGAHTCCRRAWYRHVARAECEESEAVDYAQIQFVATAREA